MENCLHISRFMFRVEKFQRTKNKKLKRMGLASLRLSDVIAKMHNGSHYKLCLWRVKNVWWNKHGSRKYSYAFVFFLLCLILFPYFHTFSTTVVYCISLVSCSFVLSLHKFLRSIMFGCCNDNSLDSVSGGTRFESRPGYPSSWGLHGLTQSLQASDGVISRSRERFPFTCLWLYHSQPLLRLDTV